MNFKTKPFFVLLVGISFHRLTTPAHRTPSDRLRTIISYDRICVLDAGQIAVSGSIQNQHSMLSLLFDMLRNLTLPQSYIPRVASFATCANNRLFPWKTSSWLQRGKRTTETKQ